MQMKRVSVLILAVVLLSLTAGCNMQSKEPGRYYSKSKGLSIQLPVGWERSERPPLGIEILVANPENTEKISVQAQKISPQQSLENGFHYMKSHIQRLGGEVSSEGQEVVDDHEAKWFVCDVQGEKIIYYLLKKDDHLYAIMLGCDRNAFTEDFESRMRAVVATIRLTR